MFKTIAAFLVLAVLMAILCACSFIRGKARQNTEKNSAKIALDDKTFLLDVRTEKEFAAGHLRGAVNIPVEKLMDNLKLLPGKDTAICLYCRSGRRSGNALEMLRGEGYADLHNLGGMEEAAKTTGLEVVK